MRLFDWEIKKTPRAKFDLRAINKIKLEKDDVLVVHCANVSLAPEMANELRARLATVFGSDREIIVFDRGITLTIVSNPNEHPAE